MSGSDPDELTPSQAIVGSQTASGDPEAVPTPRERDPDERGPRPIPPRPQGKADEESLEMGEPTTPVADDAT